MFALSMEKYGFLRSVGSLFVLRCPHRGQGPFWGLISRKFTILLQKENRGGEIPGGPGGWDFVSPFLVCPGGLPGICSIPEESDLGFRMPRDAGNSLGGGEVLIHPVVFYVRLPRLHKKQTAALKAEKRSKNILWFIP